VPVASTSSVFLCPWPNLWQQCLADGDGNARLAGAGRQHEQRLPVPLAESLQHAAESPRLVEPAWDDVVPGVHIGKRLLV
jgi:hypothetical protein